MEARSKALRKNGKRAKDLNALLGNEFIRMGNALLRKRKRKQDAFVKGLSDKEEEEEEGGEDVEEQEEQPSKEQRYASRLRALLKSESRVFTLVWCAVGVILWYGWAGFVLLNVNIPCGYNAMRLPPSPGPYYCTRYGFQWGLFYFLWFNWVPPILLLLGVVLVRSRVILTVHFLVNIVLVAGNLVCFFCLLGIMWGWCNNYASFGSPCNAAVNCCVNGGSSFAPGWCPTPGVCNPQVSFSQLSASQPFYLTWLFTVFFFLYSFFALGFETNLLR